MLVNSYFGVLQGVQNDFGIGALPNYVEIDTEQIKQVLPQETSDPVPVFFTYPEELRKSKKIETFKNFIIDEIKEYQHK